MDWKDDMVHNQAFKVTKKDVISSIKHDRNLQLTYAMGFDYSFDEFIKENIHIINESLEKETKTDSIIHILNHSNSLQEYTLLIIAYAINLKI